MERLSEDRQWKDSHVFQFPTQKLNPFILEFLGPVVQSIVSLASSLVVRMLIVLVNTISNSQVFLLKKCE